MLPGKLNAINTVSFWVGLGLSLVPWAFSTLWGFPIAALLSPGLMIATFARLTLRNAQSKSARPLPPIYPALLTTGAGTAYNCFWMH